MTKNQLSEGAVEPLGASVHQDVVVYPTLRRPDMPDRLLMGVFDSTGQPLPESMLTRRSGEIGAPMPAGQFSMDTRAPLDEGIYCGVLFNHFGHFLVESLARVWFAEREPGAPLIWAGGSRWAEGMTLKPWQEEILDILGVHNPRLVVTTPTPVRRLHLPDIGYRYDDWCHPQHATFLAAYHGPTQDSSLKLWLSRSRISKDVRDLNSETVERRLADAGWLITYPEQHTVREQLDTLSRASVIAGEEGSAFHALMLLDDVSGKTLEIMRRLGAEHRNMRTVGEARRLAQTFHTLKNQVVVKRSGRYVTKVSANASEVLDVLSVPVPEDKPEAVDPRSAELVSRIADSVGAMSFLEVGVTRRTAITLCELHTRTSVAIELPFDPRAHETRNLRFFEMPVGMYVTVIDEPHRYDLIRVDALDPASGLRGLIATQPLTHRGSVWLIDLPTDPAEAATFMVRLHDLLPWVSSRRFADDDAVRALVWRSLSTSIDNTSITIAGRASVANHGEIDPRLPPVDDVDVVLEVLQAQLVGMDRPASGSRIAELESENRLLRSKLRRLRNEKQQLEQAPMGRFQQAAHRARTAMSRFRRR